MPTINQLNTITTPSGSDLLPVFSQPNGDARKLSLTNFANWLQTQIMTSDNKVTQYSAPSANNFLTVINDTSNSVWLILTPTAGFALGTIKLPTLAYCIDKQELLVNSTQSVNSLTIDGNGATVTGGPSALTANAFFKLRFDAVMATWYRVG